MPTATAAKQETKPLSIKVDLNVITGNRIAGSK